MLILWSKILLNSIVVGILICILLMRSIGVHHLVSFILRDRHLRQFQDCINLICRDYDIGSLIPSKDRHLRGVRVYHCVRQIHDHIMRDSLKWPIHHDNQLVEQVEYGYAHDLSPHLTIPCA